MPITAFPFGVSSFGMPVMGGGPGIPASTGSYYFVCNASGANGSDGNPGTAPNQPLATVNAALGKCTAGKGDVVIVMPGHAETVTATSIAQAISGVQVIGLGTGTLRPTFTFGAAAATITVSAANCAWRNMRFVANFADVASAFTVSAKGLQVTDSEFLDTDASHNFLCNVTTGAVDNASDYLVFDRNQVQSLVVTDGACVSVLGNLLNLSICDNIVTKDATSDAGHLATFSSKVITNLRMLRNTLVMKALASQSTGTLLTGSSTTSSGIVADNYVYQIDTSTGLLATTGQKFGYIQNFMSGAADASGTVFPAADNPA